MCVETRVRSILAVLLVCPLLLADALAAESKDKPKPTKADCSGPDAARNPACKDPDNPFLKAARGKPGQPAEDKVYGNEDLERLFGPPPPEEEPAAEPPAAAVPGEAPPAQPGDPLAELQAQRRKAEERAAAIVEAEKKIADLNERIANLERTKIAIHNPLLARPVAPEGSGPEWDNMAGPERVAVVDRLIEATRIEIQQAEQELERVRRGEAS
jgi:hypothetical protein